MGLHFQERLRRTCWFVAVSASETVLHVKSAFSLLGYSKVASSSFYIIAIAFNHRGGGCFGNDDG